MAVLVTGGAGYIGSHTAVALHEAGRKVVLLDNFDNSSPAAVDAIRALTTSDMTFVEGDLRDRSVLDHIFETHGIDEVVHFAAHKAVGESVTIPLDYYATISAPRSGSPGPWSSTVCASSSSLVVHGLWPA